MSPTMAALAVVAAFLVGRLYGISVGMQRREERIERQRGVEIKHLLAFIRQTWEVQRIPQYSRSSKEEAK